MVYALAGGDVADLLKAARTLLTQMLTGQNELLAELLGAEPRVSREPRLSSGWTRVRSVLPLRADLAPWAAARAGTCSPA